MPSGESGKVDHRERMALLVGDKAVAGITGGFAFPAPRQSSQTKKPSTARDHSLDCSGRKERERASRGNMLFCEQPSRRDGRVVEGARLESVYRGNSIEGSNPSLSAIIADDSSPLLAGPCSFAIESFRELLKSSGQRFLISGIAPKLRRSGNRPMKLQIRLSRIVHAFPLLNDVDSRAYQRTVPPKRREER